LLYTVGRQGATAGLGLETIGLDVNKRGLITVNENYQTKVSTARTTPPYCLHFDLVGE
jgi:pyruvate/2-oxoglutarate dehydrogenase complex dihydrolipoamide dehydrogenase (E3) component